MVLNCFGHLELVLYDTDGAGFQSLNFIPDTPSTRFRISYLIPSFSSITYDRIRYGILTK